MVIIKEKKDSMKHSIDNNDIKNYTRDVLGMKDDMRIKKVEDTMFNVFKKEVL